MKHRNWLALALVLAAAPPVLGAAKDQQPPDKEMLKMLEFLREMEMIKRVDMMQDLHHVEAVDDRAMNSMQPKAVPVKKKETPK